MDFTTLYVIILLNAASLCAIWGAIAYTYRDLAPARFWLLSCVLPLLSGVVLALQGANGFLLPTLLANALGLLGLFSMWMGVRVFHGKGAFWRTALLATAALTAAMAATFYPWWGRNPLFSAAQAVPMIMTAVFLLHPERRSLGGRMSAIALSLAAAVNGSLAIANATLLTHNPLPQAVVTDLAGFSLAAMIFSMVVANFGLIVMTVDRLRSDIAHLALLDPLTGVHNRRHLMEHLPAVLRDAAEKNLPVALMVLDLDRFKSINDSYGHAAGDACLVHVAAVIKAALGPRDVLARMGGDEFCILVGGTIGGSAEELAARIVRSVRATPLSWRGIRLGLSISVGLTLCLDAAEASAEALFEDADTALYDAKTRGRDCYAIYSPTHALKSA